MRRTLVPTLLLLLGCPRASAKENASGKLTASSRSYGFDAIANTTTEDSLVSAVESSASPTQTAASQEHANCEWEGVLLRHGMAKYFVGHAHRRGSIYGLCLDGEMRCFEDAGLADAPITNDKAVMCERHSMAQRQRDLDLEDRAVAELPSPAV